MMIDSGCNTILLPIDNGQIESIYNKFANNDYIWNIFQSKGVSSLNAAILQIKSKIKPIKMILGENIFNYQEDIKIIRFHLCYDDIQWIIKNDNKMLNINEINILKELYELMNDIKNKYPKIEIGKRRKHGLIGQSILCSDWKICLQTKDVFVLINDIKSENDWNNNYQIMIDCEKEAQSAIRKSFNNDKEFNDLEDDDHDQDDSNGDLAMMDDYIDELIT